MTYGAAPAHREIGQNMVVRSYDRHGFALNPAAWDPRDPSFRTDQVEGAMEQGDSFGRQGGRRAVLNERAGRIEGYKLPPGIGRVFLTEQNRGIRMDALGRAHGAGIHRESS